MKKSTSLFIAAAVVVLGVSVGVVHAQGGHGHGHDHGSGAAAGGSKYTLNKGQKWKTDEQLRGGMTAIRNELQAALDPIHAGRYSPADYQALAGRIEKQITDVIAKCKLPPEVDAQVHLVLGEVFVGTDLMKKDGDRMSGAVKVIGALRSYETYFEHAGWKPIVH